MYNLMEKNIESVCILGGEGKLGRRLASFFHEVGLHVISIDKSLSPNHDKRVEFFPCNMSDLDDAINSGHKLMKSSGGVMYCVSAIRYRPEEPTSLDAILSESYKTSVLGPHLFMDQMTRSATQNTLTSVVHITSVLGQLITRSQSLSYHLEKAAQESLMRWQAVTWGPLGISVNAVAPGYIDYHAQTLRSQFETSQPPIIDEKLLANIHPLKVLVTPEAIFEAVLFLLRSKGLTGQILKIEAGSTLLEQLGLLTENQPLWS